MAISTKEVKIVPTTQFKDDKFSSMMHQYRSTMAEVWFPNDPQAQSRYIEESGMPPSKVVIRDLVAVCDQTIVGTMAGYDFAQMRHLNNLMSGNGEKFSLLNLPEWLSTVSYLGDISVVSSSQISGLSQKLINFFLAENKGKTVIGITRKDNTAMQKLVKKTKGVISNDDEYLFVKLSLSERSILLEDIKNLVCKTIYLDRNYSPVAYMFFSRDRLVAVSIARSSSTLNVKNAYPTGGMDDLFNKQCVTIIDPALKPDEINQMKLLSYIYQQTGRFRYNNIFQLRKQKKDVVKLPSNSFVFGSSEWLIFQYLVS